MLQATLVACLLVSLIIDIIICAFAITRPDHSRALYFAALAAALFLYLLGYIIEIMSQTPEAAMNALRMENFGIPLVGPLFFLTSVSLFDAHRIKSWMLPVAFTYGFCIFLVVFFNNEHGMYYAAVDMVHNGEFYVVSLKYGPLYYLQQGVTTVCMLFGYYVLLRRFVHGTAKLRRQMAVFLLGSLFAFSANIMNFLHLLPSGLDPTPLALTVSLALFSVDLWRNRFLDVVSVAFNTAVDTMDDAMVVLDADGGYVYSNHSAQTLFPSLVTFSGAEQITKLPGWPPELLDGTETGRFTFWRKPPREKEERSYRAVVSQVKNRRAVALGWSIVMRDITDMSEMINKLEALSITDPLTGISNRRHFYNMAGRELAQAKRMNQTKALILYDIDHFKRVNDTYGHQAGDQVLIAVAKTVQDNLRAYDLLARYGGEEFIIFTTVGESEKELMQFAERLRALVEETIVVCEKVTVQVTASFGVTALPPGSDIETAMNVVDEAMYAAKNEGRNRVIYRAYNSLLPKSKEE